MAWVLWLPGVDTSPGRIPPEVWGSLCRVGPFNFPVELICVSGQRQPPWMASGVLPGTGTHPESSPERRPSLGLC